jgi:hypothetical protein
VAAARAHAGNGIKLRYPASSQLCAIKNSDNHSSSELHVRKRNTCDLQVMAEFVKAWDSEARKGIFEAEKFAIDVTKTPRFDLLKRSQYTYFGEFRRAKRTPLGVL